MENSEGTGPAPSDRARTGDGRSLHGQQRIGGCSRKNPSWRRLSQKVIGRISATLCRASPSMCRTHCSALVKGTLLTMLSTGSVMVNRSVPVPQYGSRIVPSNDATRQDGWRARPLGGNPPTCERWWHHAVLLVRFRAWLRRRHNHQAPATENARSPPGNRSSSPTARHCRASICEIVE